MNKEGSPTKKDLKSLEDPEGLSAEIELSLKKKSIIDKFFSRTKNE